MPVLARSCKVPVNPSERVAAEEIPTSKLQIPNKHQDPSSKSKSCGAESLGAWDLGFPLRRRRSGRRAEIKLHRWRAFRTCGGSEERTRRETEHPGDHISRKTAHGDVIALHNAVE